MKAKMLFIPLLSIVLVACESHSKPTPPSSQNQNPNRTMNTSFPANSTNSTFSSDRMNPNMPSTSSSDKLNPNMPSKSSSDKLNPNMPSNRTNSTFSSDRMNSNANTPDTMFIEIQGADNTGRNVRDRQSGSLTSFDQSESEPDRTISVTIRRALISDPSLSTNAKNIKVITVNGVVTLRGPVNTPQEKAIIEQIISRVAGIQRVDNQLEVLQQANR